MADPIPSADRPGRGRGPDRRPGADTLFYGLALLCAGLLLADFCYHKHASFAFEGWFGFFAWYGFICCVALVLLAKALRKLVRRDEGYYGD